MAGYPKRDSHFAHRFVRVLQKSCAAQDIGPHACLLLCYISHTEDAARYSGPVRFWNSQLEQTMGYNSPKQLNNARHRAVEAGWLHYERKGTRGVGEYYVIIPERFRTISDAPIEEPILSENGKNEADDSFRIRKESDSILSDSGTNSGKNHGKNCGKLSNPIPNPNPNTNSCTVAATRPAVQDQKVDASSSKHPKVDPLTVAYPEFPCVPGKSRGPWVWLLSAAAKAELASAFPSVDVDGEGRKAIAWIKADLKRRKTHDGMLKFITNWMNNAQNRSPSRAVTGTSEPRRDPSLGPINTFPRRRAESST
jgi:hypothetical protein